MVAWRTFHPVWLSATALLLLIACPNSGLLSGKQCDPQQHCLSGYFCDLESNICLKGAPTDGGDADGGDGDGGDNDGDADGDFDPSLPEPIVLYTFEDVGADLRVLDRAPLPPDVSLSATERQPLGLNFSDHAVGFSGGMLEASADDSEDLIRHLVTAGSFTAVVWTNTNASSQNGPARILTLSSGADTRALTLGHADRDLVAWLVTADTDPGGLDHALGAETFTTGHTHQIALVFDGAEGLASVYVDGEQRDSRIHRVDGEPAQLPWHAERERLGLGNEFGLAFPWDGELYRVAIYDRALLADQVAQLYSQGWDR